MFKSVLLTVAVLLCVPILSTSVRNRTCVFAHRPSSPAARRQQALVKRINQGALTFYKTFIRQSVRTTATVDCDVNDLLEDLLLAADGLNDSRYRQHNLVIVMQIASDIEQELLWVDVPTRVVMAWARLHADIDRLAKMNGLKWSETVITDALIAALASDLDTASNNVQSELSPYQPISLTSSTDLLLLLSNFRNLAQELKTSSVDKLHYRIETVRAQARTIAASFDDTKTSSALQRDWRRFTARLEELLRLYRLDSITEIK